MPEDLWSQTHIFISLFEWMCAGLEEGKNVGKDKSAYQTHGGETKGSLLYLAIVLTIFPFLLNGNVLKSLSTAVFNPRV